MLLVGIQLLRISAIVPAVIAATLIGGAAYLCNSEIDAFGNQAKSDLRSYVTSVPRDVSSLGDELSTARSQVSRGTRRTVNQVTLAGRELRAAISEQSYWPIFFSFSVSGNVIFALACAIAGFFIVYYRAVRKSSGGHPRLKVF